MSFFSDKKLSKGMKAYHQRKSLQKFGKLLVDVDQELWLFGLFNHNQSGPYSATTTQITELTITFLSLSLCANLQVSINSKTSMMNTKSELIKNDKSLKKNRNGKKKSKREEKPKKERYKTKLNYDTPQ